MYERDDGISFFLVPKLFIAVNKLMQSFVSFLSINFRKLIATQKANASHIPNSLGPPSTLFWHKNNTRKNVMYRPCRECHKDEAFGLNLPQTWNEKEKVLVQYFEKCTFEKRNLVKRKMLIPFYGGQENEIRNPCVDKRNRISNLGTVIIEDEIKELHKNIPSESKLQWCDQHLDLLTKQLKRRKRDEVYIQAELLFLKRIVKSSQEKHLYNESLKKTEIEESEENEAVHENALEQEIPFVSQSTQSEEEQDQESSDNSTSEINFKVCRPKSEILRPGDIVAYYHPTAIVGDKRGYREAKILSVTPKRDPVLVLDNGEYTCNDTLMKRVRIICRGKLVDNSSKGTFNEVSKYKHRKAGNADFAAGMKQDVKRLNTIMNKKTAKLREKGIAAGLGDCSDYLHQCGPSKSCAPDESKKAQTPRKKTVKVKTDCSDDLNRCELSKHVVLKKSQQTLTTEKKKIVKKETITKTNDSSKLTINKEKVTPKKRARPCFSKKTPTTANKKIVKKRIITTKKQLSTPKKDVGTSFSKKTPTSGDKKIVKKNMTTKQQSKLTINKKRVTPKRKASPSYSKKTPTAGKKKIVKKKFITTKKELSTPKKSISTSLSKKTPNSGSKKIVKKITSPKKLSRLTMYRNKIMPKKRASPSYSKKSPTAGKKKIVKKKVITTKKQLSTPKKNVSTNLSKKTPTSGGKKIVKKNTTPKQLSQLTMNKNKITPKRKASPSYSKKSPTARKKKIVKK